VKTKYLYLLTHIASISTTLQQSQTAQTIVEELSIWCMGLQCLVTFSLNSTV